MTRLELLTRRWRPTVGDLVELVGHRLAGCQPVLVEARVRAREGERVELEVGHHQLRVSEGWLLEQAELGARARQAEQVERARAARAAGAA